MSSATFSDIDNSIGVIVYDLTLPLPERKEKAITFSSMKKAGERLGVSLKTIIRLASKREHVYCEKLKKNIAIRYLNQK